MCSVELFTRQIYITMCWWSHKINFSSKIPAEYLSIPYHNDQTIPVWCFIVRFEQCGHQYMATDKYIWEKVFVRTCFELIRNLFSHCRIFNDVWDRLLHYRSAKFAATVSLTALVREVWLLGDHLFSVPDNDETIRWVQNFQGKLAFVRLRWRFSSVARAFRFHNNACFVKTSGLFTPHCSDWDEHRVYKFARKRSRSISDCNNDEVRPKKYLHGGRGGLN